MVGFCAINLEHFWIDAGLSGMIKECETFISETIKNDLELARPGQALKNATTSVSLPE